jgi:hypothetical protein
VSDLDALLDTVWSEVTEEVRKALDTLSTASMSVLDAECERIDRELRVLTFKRGVLKAELDRRTP